jgi:hypothetical protein
MALYKYCKEPYDILTRCQISFTPLAIFNDPFDCLPDSTLVTNPKRIADFKESTYRDLAFSEAFASIKEHRRARVPPRHVADEAVDAYFRENRVEMQRQSLQAHRKATRDFRILSLSRVPADAPEGLLLWAHYTDGHKGVVFELDEAHPWIADHGKVKAGPTERGDVNYSEKRATWEGSMPQTRSAYIKSTHWAYEKEVRLIRFKGITDGLDDSKWDSLVNFDPQCLRSVTLGVNCPPGTEASIREALLRPELAHVALMKAKLHPDEFRVVVKPLPR